MAFSMDWKMRQVQKGRQTATGISSEKKKWKRSLHIMKHIIIDIATKQGWQSSETSQWMKTKTCANLDLMAKLAINICISNADVNCSSLTYDVINLRAVPRSQNVSERGQTTILIEAPLLHVVGTKKYWLLSFVINQCLDLPATINCIIMFKWQKLQN